MGKEASRRFVCLNASKVITVIRSLSKGLAAQNDIETTTSRPGSTEVWECDLVSYDSVKDFAARVGKLERVDAVVMITNIAMGRFEVSLLVRLIVPALRISAEEWRIVPVVTVVSFRLAGWKYENILATLNDEKKADLTDSYDPQVLN